MRVCATHPCPFHDGEPGKATWESWARALLRGEYHGDEPWPARLRQQGKRKLPGARTWRDTGIYTGRVAPPRIYKDPATETRRGPR